MISRMFLVKIMLSLSWSSY